LTPGRCPEDPDEVDDIACDPDPDDCHVDADDAGQWRRKEEQTVPRNER
jgi:hypothetical protein